MVYIALLRGINVSGQKIIRMEALKSAIETLGYQDITTYIQSGNIVFRTDQPEPEPIAAQLHQLIREKFGFEVVVVVLPLAELEQIVSQNPFPADKLQPTDKLYFSILKRPPMPDKISLIQQYDGGADEMKVQQRTVYVCCREGYGKSIFSNNFVEKILKVEATTRNLATMQKLIELGNKLINK